MKKWTIRMLVCAVLVGLFYLSAQASNVIASGYCGGEGDGTNLTWTLYEGGELVIAGTGAMKDYSILTPWDDITVVTIGNGVTTIGDDAFNYCGTSLTSVTIPDSVTTIGESAFISCSKLTSVYYSGDVAGWCEIQFANAGSNPLLFARNLYLEGRLVTDLIIPEGVSEVKDHAFACYTTLTSVTIPSSVNSIGERAFKACYKNLKRMEFLGDAPAYVGSDAFTNCDELTIYYHEGTTGWMESVYYDATNGTWCGYPLVMIPASYTITVDTVANGTVTVDKMSGEAGEIVTVTAIPDDGYKLTAILIDGDTINGNTFAVTGNHTVFAVFEACELLYISQADVDSYAQVGPDLWEYTVYNKQGVAQTIVVRGKASEFGFYCYKVGQDDIYTLIDEVIYIPDGLDCSWITAQGYVYEVYNTKGELIEITLKKYITQSGFYGVATNESGVSSLIDISATKAVKSNQTLKTIYKNLLYTNGIDHYDMSNAVIVDARSEMDLEMSEIPALETGEDLLLAQNVAEIKLDAFVDAVNKTAEIIFVTSATLTEDSGSSGGTGEVREGRLVTVTKVDDTAGEESITIFGMGKLENNASLDQVTEYEGVAAGDIAICVWDDEKWVLSPTTTVEGQIIKIRQNNGQCYITVGDTEYTLVYHPGRTTLCKGIYDVNFWAESRLYIAPDGTCVGFEVISYYLELMKKVLAVAVYEVSNYDNYGNETRTVYAQGVDVNGVEVNYVIGVAKEDRNDVDGDGDTGWDILYDDGIEELGMSYDPAASYDERLTGDFVSGFYTFEKNYDADAAALGVMIPSAVSVDYDSLWMEGVFGRKAALDDGFELTPETLYVPTSEDVAYLTKDTRYITYNGAGGPLETRLFENGISYSFTDGEQAELLLSKDKYGNTVVEAIFICTEPEMVTPSVVYQIAVDTASGGTIRVDKSSAAKGETVTVTTGSNAGYLLESILVDGKAIEGNTFTVTGEHTVSAVFNPIAIDDIVYVVSKYTVEGANEYGTPITLGKVQGINMAGNEVNYVVAVDSEYKNDDGLEIWESISPGFYAFEKNFAISALGYDGKSPVCVPAEYDEQLGNYYTRKTAVSAGFELTPEAKRVTTEESEFTYLTRLTQYIAVDGVLDQMKSKRFQAGVACVLNEQAHLLLSRDEKGNIIVETMIIFADPETVTPGEEYNYSVTTERVDHGTISVDKATAKKGETVTVTATPAWGYALKEILVDGLAIEGNSFTVTGSHVATAVFEPIVDAKIVYTDRHNANLMLCARQGGQAIVAFYDSTTGQMLDAQVFTMPTGNSEVTLTAEEVDLMAADCKIILLDGDRKPMCKAIEP